MKLTSELISIRYVEESDAEFILSLRLDNRYNKYLSKVDSDINNQIAWIRNYKKDEANKLQFYFIIERNDGVPCGTVRIYDLREDSFCWGSWILNENKTKKAALSSALLVYQFGFNYLGFHKAHFDVMKENKGVISFHKRMGAKLISEDSENLYFEILKENIEEVINNID